MKRPAVIKRRRRALGAWTFTTRGFNTRSWRQMRPRPRRRPDWQRNIRT